MQEDDTVPLRKLLSTVENEVAELLEELQVNVHEDFLLCVSLKRGSVWSS